MQVLVKMHIPRLHPWKPMPQMRAEAGIHIFEQAPLVVLLRGAHSEKEGSFKNVNAIHISRNQEL